MTLVEPEYEKSGWAMLLKFGRKEHLQAFQQDGLLHMNPLSHFSKLESDAVRADRFEGTDRIYQPKDVRSFTIKNHRKGIDIVIPPWKLASPLLVGFGATTHCNVFCMFAVTSPSAGAFVDERNFAFGDSFIIVLDTQEFIDRVARAATATGLRPGFGLVEYYDYEQYSGETGPFRKPSTFAYQNEFRVVALPGSQDPRRLVTGSLEDITTPVFPLSEINRIVDFGSLSACQVEPVGQPAEKTPPAQ